VYGSITGPIDESNDWFMEGLIHLFIFYRLGLHLQAAAMCQKALAAFGERGSDQAKTVGLLKELFQRGLLVSDFLFFFDFSSSFLSLFLREFSFLSLVLLRW
jgi:hypothetical protein